METDVVIAGFGGQGIMLIGKILAYAAMNEGKEVSWLPSYGPEMRGGTANCSVVISDRPVGSPLVTRPRALVAMNLPSLDKFEVQVKPGGVLLINTSLVHRRSARTDLTVIEVPANEIAMSLEAPRSANIVALGAYLGATAALPLAAVHRVVSETFAGKPNAAAVNLQALEQGYAVGAAHRQTAEVLA